MKILTLTCNECGAPLEVPAKTRFLTCTFCSSQLEVHRSGGAAYTEVLEALQEGTEQVAGDVETLELKLELENLDREWVEERKRYVGESDSEPTKKGVMLGAGFWGLFMGMVMVGIGVMAPLGDARFFCIPSGILLIGVALFLAPYGFSRVKAYNRAKESYERRR